MKSRHTLIKLMTIVVIGGLAGCDGSLLKPIRGGRGKPVSSPPSGPSETGPQSGRARYADTHPPTVDTTAERPDPAIAQLDARIRQYAGRCAA